jgi:two-component system, LuxR family, sensor kinase FixL
MNDANAVLDGIADRGALFDALASTAADGVMVIDEKGSVLFYNGACQQLFQYPPQEVIGQNVKMLMPAPYRAEHDGYIARYKATREPHIIGVGREVTGRRKDGSVFPMYLSVGEGKLSGGRVFVGIVHDLTAIKAQVALREDADRHLAQIVQSSEDAILGKTLDGTVTSWNNAAERIFGYSAAEMIGKPIFILTPPDRLSEENRILEKITTGRSIEHYETVRRRKDGNEILVSLSVSPIRDNAGHIVGASKIARDITEKKRAEARAQTLQSELEHVDRLSAMGQLSSALAHELNQPLSAAMNYVNAARRRLKTIEGAATDKVSELLEKAVSETDRAGQIIHRLRRFLEKREPHHTAEDLNEIAKDAVALGQGGAAYDNVELLFALEPGLPAVVADRVQIEQVMVNLLRNAIEAMEASPVRKVTISTYVAGPKFAEAAIADTGPGIPDEVAVRLFEPFVTTKEKGMGVGLSICRTIVEAHGGQLWMTPNPEGGTIFRFQLPLAVEQ